MLGRGRDAPRSISSIAATTLSAMAAGAPGNARGKTFERVKAGRKRTQLRRLKTHPLELAPGAG
jgi:hypothetical protein